MVSRAFLRRNDIPLGWLASKIGTLKDDHKLFISCLQPIGMMPSLSPLLRCFLICLRIRGNQKSSYMTWLVIFILQHPEKYEEIINSMMLQLHSIITNWEVSGGGGGSVSCGKEFFGDDWNFLLFIAYLISGIVLHYTANYYCFISGTCWRNLIWLQHQYRDWQWRKVQEMIQLVCQLWFAMEKWHENDDHTMPHLCTSITNAYD